MKRGFSYWKALTMASVVAWGFAIVLSGRVVMARQAQQQRITEGYEVVSVAPKSLDTATPCVEGYEKAPYTLNVFFDYECPYCREDSVALDRLIKKYPADLRVAFRNFPLEVIHENAWRAAVASVIAGRHGAFPKMRARLVTSNLSSKEVQSHLKSVLPGSPIYERESQEAAKQVLDDVALAKQLEVNSTPSFFLLDQKGVTRRFDSVEKIATFLERMIGKGEDCLNGCRPSP